MKKLKVVIVAIWIYMISLSPVFASGGDPHIGEYLPLYSVLPFVGMLLSIAIFPLVAPRFWHHHFGKVSAFWSVVIIIPLLVAYKATALHEILHIILADYIPFIILLGSLYTVSGGILLKGTLRGTPVVNTVMITIGTLLASWMGTTGAAMLLIRPFLRANAHRKSRTFMVVFFIFTVANIGGSLTPLGDPPLFLGFLRGVPFFWTFNLLPHMIIAVSILIVLYFVFDMYFYKKEGIQSPPDDGTKEPIRLEGIQNFLFIAGIVGAVLLSGMVHWGELSLLGVHRAIQDIVRDVLLVMMGLLSLIFTKRRIREDNDFTWFPIKEVAILFIGIFLTMIPCLKILQAGTKGELDFIIAAVQNPVHYFWITGTLSAFLDNAPTYLTFLSTAMGSFYSGVPETQAVTLLIKENPLFLLAISAGAVFFGANTYIGNAPNFMVRSIAEESGTPMPSFFGYMIKYSIPILVPVFIVITFIFFL
ncbi:MAG: sodium:proton antiporter [Nitrospiraceae bacterium]|nr:MAG: sodium:proton antiporter [Nitrospiraceae bacterium]